MNKTNGLLSPTLNKRPLNIRASFMENANIKLNPASAKIK